MKMSRQWKANTKHCRSLLKADSNGQSNLAKAVLPTGAATW